MEKTPKQNEMTKFEQEIQAYREAQKKARGEEALKTTSEQETRSEQRPEPAKPEQRPEPATSEPELVASEPAKPEPTPIRSELESVPQKEPELKQDDNLDLEDALVRELENQLAKEQQEQLLKEHEEQLAKKELLIEQIKQKKAQGEKLSKEEIHILLDHNREQRSAMETKHPEFLENKNPLIAINTDWTHDKEEIAHDLAGQALNKELDEAKGIKSIAKRIWKGTLFKEYYTEKYKNEFMEGKRTNEHGKTVQDIIKEQKDVVLERFTQGVIEGEASSENEGGFVHKKAGEKLTVADEKTNEDVKKAIMDYAHRKVDLGENIEDLNREFKDNMTRILREAIDEGRIKNGAKYTNYLATAKEAAKRYQDLMIQGREKIEHDAAMAQVMAGFQVYNAEVRNGVRTEAHRNNIDKIINKLGKSKLGNIVSSEILYGVVGTAQALTQTGARAILGAAGGIIASSAISGLKERNRITEDRVRMMRDIANGMDYNSDNAKTAKYEKNIGGTLYDTQKASHLTSDLKNAMESDDKNALLRAIAEARVRIDYSDAEQKDLISYSSADKRGKERLDLDIALIKAEKSLSGKDQKKLNSIKESIREDILEGYMDESGEFHAGVAEKDEDFKKMRAYAIMKKAGKTLAIGTAVFFGSQEIMAAIDPSKIGIFEKAGLLKTENATDAKETLLASGFGKFRGSYDITTTNTEQIENISDPDQVRQYEAAGYTKTETAAAWTDTKSTITEVDPSASTARINVKYDGWGGNGTKFADGNELRAHIVDGKFISNMQGTSSYDGGATIDYGSSNIKAFITIGDSKFEIAGDINDAGQLTWGEGGVFTTTTGETIKAIGDNGERLYKYFEIAADQGIDGDGIQHIIPLATDVGTNTFSDKITQVTEEIIEHPATYTFVKSIPKTETFIRGVTTNGVAIAPPDLLRHNLGAARAPETQPEPQPVSRPETTPEATLENQEVTSETAKIEIPEPRLREGASPESDRWNEQIITEILDNRDLLRSDNGIDGYYMLTDPTPLNEETSDRYLEYWQNLSEEGKAEVGRIMDKINSSDYRYDLEWGNGFNTWYTLTVR